MAIVVGHPAGERTRADAFKGEKQTQSDKFTGIQVGIRVLGHIAHHTIDPNEQSDDKIFG